ncbi:hypothetical protein ACOMHN_009798 [Nucella lapillus]
MELNLISDVVWMLMTMSVVKSISQSCDVIAEKDWRAGHTIWNYMLMNHTFTQCDVIVALGSYYVRVARRAADRWLRGGGEQWLVMSGHTGHLTKNLWTRSEADIFRAVAVGRGVPRERILLERESTNTGENVRRAYSTFQAQWPHSTAPVDVFVTSPDVTLLNYPNDDVGSLSDVISVMMGDMQRNWLYGELGFQTKQAVPQEVTSAFEYLRDTGRYSGYFQ